jgi:tetratricopeptide (TPR) repeat protein
VPIQPQNPYHPHEDHQDDEESDVLRRAFMTRGGVTVAAASLGPLGLALDASAAPRPTYRADARDADAVEEAVRRIRLLDDRHGADGLYRRAAAPLRAAYALLDAGATRQATADRLYSGVGELAISVGWLAHDSGRFDDARSHYAEALATARMTGDPALEAHAFCNTAFLARDAGRPREAVRAAQAAQRVGRGLGSARLMSLLALREAGGWAGLADRAGCEQALARAQALFERGPSDADPEWMSFYGEAELEGLEAQCWSALGDWSRAARHARRAAQLQDPHFARNIALYTAELADDLARGGHPDEAAAAGMRVLDLLGEVQSSRIQTMLAGTARVLLPHRRESGVSAFLERHAGCLRTA